MEEELGYQSLRCVLEYLEPNKRIHITARSERLRSFEKSIPLHMDFLQFTKDGIRINNIEYSICKAYDRIDPQHERYKDRYDKCKLTPGDIQSDREMPWFAEYLEMSFGRMNPFGLFIDRRFPETMQKHVALKIMACLFFEGRCQILTKSLSFANYNYQIIRLPVGFEVHTNRVLCEFQDFPYLLPIVKTESVLDELGTHIMSDNTFEHVLLKTAKRLIIYEMMAEYTRRLPTLMNKYVGIKEECFTNANIILIVRHLIEHPREIGTIWEIRKRKNENCLRLLEKVMTMFNGTKVEVEEEEKKRSNMIISSYISIPIDYKSELHVFAMESMLPHEPMCFNRLEVIKKPITEGLINKYVLYYVGMILDFWNWWHY